MYIDELYTFCNALKGTREDFPFDQDTLVFKVGGKMYALTSLKDWELGRPSINLKCNPDEALLLRANHTQIIPGYHMNKKHWNTVFLNNGLDDILIKELIIHSYKLVLQGLPKKTLTEL